MAEDDDLENEEVGGSDEEMTDEEEGGKKDDKKSGKKKLIIVAVVLILFVGGIAAAFFTGALDNLLGGSEEAAEGEKADVSFIYPLDEILVNLNTGGRKSQFLKITVALELNSLADQQAIGGVQTRILDNFQVYLRELRLEDLQGSAGIYRLREELLRRVRAVAAPIEVRDILFREMLVQ